MTGSQDVVFALKAKAYEAAVLLKQNFAPHIGILFRRTTCSDPVPGVLDSALPGQGRQGSGAGRPSLRYGGRGVWENCLVNVANRFGCLLLKLPALGDEGFRNSDF